MTDKETRERALVLALLIVEDSRNASRYAFAAIGSMMNPENRVTYSDMVNVLHEMLDELSNEGEKGQCVC